MKATKTRPEWILNIVLPSLLASLSFSTAGCLYATRTEQRVQNLQVVSEPAQAYVSWQKPGAEKKPLGYAPTSLKVPYEVQVQKVNRAWWWGTIGVLAATGIAGSVWTYSDTDNYSTTAQALTYSGLIGGLAAYYFFYFMDAGARSAQPAKPFPVQLHASLKGYVPQSMELLLPTEQTRVRMILPPDPDSVIAEAARIPAPSTPTSPAVGPASATRDIVAVFDIQDASGQLKKRELNQLTDYLAASLTRQTGLRVVPRDQLRQRLAGNKRSSYRTCYDESCQLELGKALSAQKSLSTKLLRIGSKCAITATLYDLRTETAEKSALHRSNCHVDSLLDAMDVIATQLR